MKKRVLALALAAVMTVSAFAGCGGNTDETTTNQATSAGGSVQKETTTSSEPATKLSILLPYGDHAYDEDAQTIELRKRLENYTNTEISWELYDANAYYEKLTLRYATGDLASIIVIDSNTNQAFINACQYNVFWDISNYLDLFPNLAAIPESVRVAASLNGKLYGVPRKRGNAGRMSTTYRQDWADKLNIGTPETIDDLYDMAVKFTNNDPDGNGQNDTYGFGWDSWDGVMKHIACWFGAPNVWGLDENGKLEYYATTEGFKNAMTWCRKVYSEGLVPADFFSVGAGKARGTWMNSSICGIYIQCLDDARKVQTTLVGTDEAPGAVPTAVMAFISDVDAGYGKRIRPQNDGFAGYVAFAKTESPTEDDLMKILQFMDDICDGEMQNLLDAGIEGQDYYLDENGYKVVNDDEQRAALGLGSSKYRNGYNQLLPYFNSEEEAAKVVVAEVTADVNIRENACYAENNKYLVPNYGTGLVSAKYGEIGADLDKIINDAMWNYIQNIIDETAFDAAIEQWFEAGGQTVIDEMNALYAANNN